MEQKILNFEALGTSWTLDFKAHLSDELFDLVETKIKNRVNDFENTFSRFISTSLVRQLSTQTGKYSFPENSKEMIEMYLKLYRITNGLFTPFVGQLLEDTGYDTTYTLTPRDVIQDVPELLDYWEVNFPEIIVKHPVSVDFGGIGKGFLIDYIAKIFDEFGIDEFTIDAGGDILHKSRNNNKLSIGMENPYDFSTVIGTVDISNVSLCGSSGSRRKWDKYHHILNPQTKSSNHDIKAVWVLAQNTLTADSVATSLFLVKPEILSSNFDFEYFILFSDYAYSKSKNFICELYI